LEQLSYDTKNDWAAGADRSANFRSGAQQDGSSAVPNACLAEHDGTGRWHAESEQIWKRAHGFGQWPPLSL
jgi:hypothetical protein